MTTNIVLGVSLVMLLCILSEKFSYKIGMPALVFFMFVGMLFGSDGIAKIPYNSYSSAETICSIALIFIMFQGGFTTNWKVARPYISKAASLSTLGVLLTALISTAGCHFLLNLNWQESFLISSVLASTDAASVFSILKRHNLDLKDGTSPILEVESGSNDPMAYLLTMTAVGIIQSGRVSNILLSIFLQIFLGFFFGILFARLTRRILSLKNIANDGMDTIIIISATTLCYALTDKLGGNAYLSVYLMGLYLGNTRINSKRVIITFFNDLTSLLQMLIFFIIGLLSTPSRMPQSIPMAITVSVILTFIARPLMTVILLRLQGCSMRQCMLISWAGLRGASSIVFAISAVSSGISLSFDLFHVVFVVSLFSIALQGALLPLTSRKLSMIDESPNIFKTFNDFEDTVDFQFVKAHINPGNSWIGQKIKKIDIPFHSQVVMIKRRDKTIAARGHTVIEEGDDLILNIPAYLPARNERVNEVHVTEKNPWVGKTLEEIGMPDNQLMIMIIRDDKKIIPNGDTVVNSGDTLLIFEGERQKKNRDAQ